jgi:hypothetical protein
MFREAFVQEKQQLVENAPSLPSGSAPSPSPSSSHVLIASFGGSVWLLLQCW